jgi:hypothetical protein
MAAGRDDEKAPARAEVSDLSHALAATAIALGTAATRLDNCAALVRRAAAECAEAARLVDDRGRADRAALLEDLERLLGDLAEDVHETRRKVRAARHAQERSQR